MLRRSEARAFQARTNSGTTHHRMKPFTTRMPQAIVLTSQSGPGTLLMKPFQSPSEMTPSRQPATATNGNTSIATIAER